MADQLRLLARTDKRISYIIFNGKIASWKKNYKWRKYTGVNPHNTHIHISFTKPRIELTAAKYLENKVLAALGNEDARQYLMAADNNTTDSAGLVPTRQLSEVINPLGTTIRPSIDAISRGVLPDAGMTFEIPKITQVPTVGEVAEDAAFTEQDQNAAFLSVSV